jgi:Ca2+-transporting ATPase
LEGLIAIREPVLPEAAKTVLRCQKAGLKVIMLSSDISENNRVMAENLGIATQPEQTVTGYDLANMREGLFRANLDVYTLYQGITVPQRRQLVRFLKEKGERVGYLCGELDEIILMREADVGFARSVTISDRADGSGVDMAGRNLPFYTKEAGEMNGGCEALKFVSDVIVSEPDGDGTGGFNAMIDAILCSKSVYFNLSAMLKYMIASQVAKLGLVLLSVLLGFTALTPPQILFCGLVIDFAAMIIIAFERADHSALGNGTTVNEKLKKPMSRNVDSVLAGLLWVVLMLLSILYMFRYRLIVADQIPTCCFIGLLLSQLSILNACKQEKSIFDRNVVVNGAYLTMLAVLIIFFVLVFLLPPFGGLFGVRGISIFAFCGAAFPTIAITLFFEVQKRINNHKE